MFTYSPLLYVSVNNNKEARKKIKRRFWFVVTVERHMRTL